MAREDGPPRRTAREIIAAVEPSLELIELRRIAFQVPSAPPAWFALARRREVPAQPSTRR